MGGTGNCSAGIYGQPKNTIDRGRSNCSGRSDRSIRCDSFGTFHAFGSCESFCTSQPLRLSRWQPHRWKRQTYGRQRQTDVRQRQADRRRRYVVGQSALMGLRCSHRRGTKQHESGEERAHIPEPTIAESTAGSSHDDHQICVCARSECCNSPTNRRAVGALRYDPRQRVATGFRRAAPCRAAPTSDQQTMRWLRGSLPGNVHLVADSPSLTDAWLAAHDYRGSDRTPRTAQRSRTSGTTACTAASSPVRRCFTMSTTLQTYGWVERRAIIPILRISTHCSAKERQSDRWASTDGRTMASARISPRCRSNTNLNQ